MSAQIKSRKIIYRISKKAVVKTNVSAGNDSEGHGETAKVSYLFGTEANNTGEKNALPDTRRLLLQYFEQRFLPIGDQLAA